jgi:hypothetical protein
MHPVRYPNRPETLADYMPDRHLRDDFMLKATVVSFRDDTVF